MNDDHPPTHIDEEAVFPGPEVTRERFLQWRSPREGAANPTVMTNPVWTWLVKSRIDAYRANRRFDGPSPFVAGPGWCFFRFGQSETRLPDGGTLWIAGEHEDWYDPNFYIYNDVVIQRADGHIEILGYPRDAFPPTDFHTATLLNDEVLLIGNLGYTKPRRPGVTQLLRLDLSDLSVSILPVRGNPPGWIHGHRATLEAGGRSIVLSGGQWCGEDSEGWMVENIDDWRLCLATWTWERLTHRRWPRWRFEREDGKRSMLWDFATEVLYADPELEPFAGQFEEARKARGTPSLKEQLGREPDFDLFRRLYSPSIPHTAIPDAEEEFGVKRVRIEGVVVRFVEEGRSVCMTVEGELPETLSEALALELRSRLSELENTPYRMTRIGDW